MSVCPEKIGRSFVHTEAFSVGSNISDDIVPVCRHLKAYSLIPNRASFREMYCLKTRQPFHSSNDSSIATQISNSLSWNAWLKWSRSGRQLVVYILSHHFSNSRLVIGSHRRVKLYLEACVGQVEPSMGQVEHSQKIYQIQQVDNYFLLTMPITCVGLLWNIVR